MLWNKMTNIINLLWTMSTTLPFRSVLPRFQNVPKQLLTCRHSVVSSAVGSVRSVPFSLVTHTVFWGVTTCSLAHGYQRFSLTCFLHIHGKASSLEMQTHSFFWNVGTYLHGYRRYIRNDGYLRCQSHDRLKCNFLFPYFHWIFLLLVVT